MYKKISLLFLSIALMGCQTTPENPEQWMTRQKNACLPTAIAFKSGLEKYGVWAEVVRYSYKNDKNKWSGHAVVAYLYPKGKNQLWTYDYLGSWKTRAFIDNPLQIAREAEKIRGRNNFVEFAEFLN
jgi:hypothetical protein